MGQILHGSTMTMQAIRALTSNEALSLVPKENHSTVLSIQGGAAAFRCHTFPPLADCPVVLHPIMPRLSHSSRRCCLQRSEISRLPDMQGDKPKGEKTKRYPIGYVNVDINLALKETGARRYHCDSYQQRQIHLSDAGSNRDSFITVGKFTLN